MGQLELKLLGVSHSSPPGSSVNQKQTPEKERFLENCATLGSLQM